MDLEAIRTKLIMVMDVVSENFPKVHKDVAEELGYTTNYIGQIKRGNNKQNDTPENREFLLDIISEYHAKIKDHQEYINNIEIK